MLARFGRPFIATSAAIVALSAIVHGAPEARLAEGTRYETSFVVRRGAAPGPTLMVVGGIHGDETAPPHAVRALEQMEIRRGKLIVVAEANRLALAAGTRHTPGDRFLDLNRNFPIAARTEPRGVLATALWRLLEQSRVDWVLDVHEGFDFHRRNPKSVGSSVTFVPHARVGACSARVARELVEHVNPTIAEKSKKFVVLAPGPEGSFARSATEALGIPSLVFETTRVAQPLGLRVSQHRALLGEALERFGMTSRAEKPLPCASP